MGLLPPILRAEFEVTSENHASLRGICRNRRKIIVAIACKNPYHVYFFFTHETPRQNLKISAKIPLCKASQRCECPCVDIATTLKLLETWEKNRQLISHTLRLLACRSICQYNQYLLKSSRSSSPSPI